MGGYMLFMLALGGFILLVKFLVMTRAARPELSPFELPSSLEEPGEGGKRRKKKKKRRHEEAEDSVPMAEIPSSSRDEIARDEDAPVVHRPSRPGPSPLQRLFAWSEIVGPPVALRDDTVEE